MDSQTSAALFLFAVLFGLAGLFFYARRRQARMLSSGTEVARFELRPERGTIKVSSSFDISTVGQWCRIGADFSMNESEWYSDRLLGKYPNFSEFHPYTIRLSNRRGKSVFEEQRSFCNFLSFAGSRNSGWSMPFKGESYKSAREGEVILLEFLPAATGIYQLDFELRAEEHTETKHFRRDATFERLTLYVREGVEPTKQAAYQHHQVDLRPK
ncbi:MAG: hypothetical protein HY914_12430 [Desulfomonile tiedjei]|nr:hypothetical protein [Desulfomonile tiedjei]